MKGTACFSRREGRGSTRRLLGCPDPFWPRIDLDALRQRMAIGLEVSDTRLELATRLALELAGREFAQWRMELRKRGYKRLEDIGGHHHGRALAVCYHRLVEVATLRALVGQTPRVSQAPLPEVSYV